MRQQLNLFTPLQICIISCLFFDFPTISAKEQDTFKLNYNYHAFLKNHCVECHNEKKKKGKVRLDNLSTNVGDAATAQQWQNILDALNAGEMPPDDEPQPKVEEKADFLDHLSHDLVLMRKKLSDQHGLLTMRRLNRREYHSTLKHLLGADINVGELPSDHNPGHFDTDGASMFMSSHQFEQYLALARNALDEAFKLETTKQVSHYKRIEAEYLSEKYRKYVEKLITNKANAEKWAAAVKEASNKPENAKIVAEIKKETKNHKKNFRREWKRIPGAPAPEEFGFNTKENNADKANSALTPYFLKYYQHYLSLDKIEEGSYLTVPTVHPSQLPTGYLEHLINFKWTPGNYTIRIRAAALPHGPRSRKFIEFGLDPRSGDVMSSHEVTAPMDSPQVIEIPLKLTIENKTRESRMIYFREKATRYFTSNPRRTFDKAKKENGLGPEYLVWVDWIEVEKNPSKQAPTPIGLATLNLPLSDHEKVSDDDVYQAIQRFSKKAFREKSVPEDYLKKLFAIYQYNIKKGLKYTDALKDTLAIVLSSPMFLYLSEESKDKAAENISDLELANRLAYFLWAGPPDQGLVELAQKNQLSKNHHLKEQTMRMLNHKRAINFIHAFTYQWLEMERIDFFEPDIKKFLKFDKVVKRSVKNEVYETIQYLFKHNLSLSDLLKSDYVIIDNVLANFYGIEGVEGDHFRKVNLAKKSPRGGLLGMSAIHLMGSNGKHTSPVERGTWVLRKLLNSPPPPAPANVPQISRLSKKILTTEERLLAHQEEPQCMSCHRKIDPIGFGLENFDPIGLWRTEDHYSVKGIGEKTWPIHASAAFYKGPSFKDYFELRDIIASKSDDFAKGFTEVLLEYGLGRSIGFSDQDLVDSILSQAKEKNYAIREFVLATVQSKAFQLK